MRASPLSRRERIVAVVLLILALVTRFYMLGDRAISHDESIHTKFSWNLYAGQGFQHNPMMHGPLLFELTALTYHILGVSDFTSRVVTALAGVALVMAPLLFRRWIGRTGAFATAALLLISPSISYYSRYVRHDVLLMLSAVLLLWVVLEYLDTGKNRWLAWLAACFSVMFATKEASYIYTAIFGGLLVLPFAYRVLTATWERKALYRVFIGLLLVAVALGGVFAVSLTAAQMTEIPLDDAGNSHAATVTIPVWGRLAAATAMLVLAAALILAAAGIGRETMRQYRLFDILMVLGTLMLPLGSAFLIKFAAGVDMDVVYEAVRTGDFAVVPVPTVVALFAVVLATLVLSAAFGLWWDRERWPRLALIHTAIFLVLYTTIFTWGFGAISGLVGGLAYWLAQHGVERGSQPWYYYGLIGPLYEYLALLLSVGGGVWALLHALRRPPAPAEERREAGTSRWPLDLDRLLPVFLLAWTLISWGAYSYAGEKMPWLLVHITLPSIFLSGWGVGHWADRTDWSRLRDRPAWVFAAALPLGVAALVVLVRGVAELRAAMQPGMPTAGPTLAQLDPLGVALGGLVGVVAFGAVLIWSARRLGAVSCLRLGAMLVVIALAGLTVRTMVAVNFIHADLATEFLVYAHGTPDIKVALARIEDVSWRVTGTANGIRVAYGEDGSWPFTWYMVGLPNNYFYSASPDAEQLLDCPVVIAGSPQYSVVEEILGEDYTAYDYLYLWWPIQDYYGLTWEAITTALRDADMRAALWDIVWRRDYGRYAALKSPDNPFDLRMWPYRKEFRLYVRRETAQETWPLSRPAGAARYVEPVATEPPDPYAAGGRALPVVAQQSFPGAMVRGLAAAGDGTLYVADTFNHRVWHVGPDGVIDSFGEYGAAAGQLNEPWDVVVDDAGYIYVADTWNHRIQKFDADYRLLASWGGVVQVSELGVPGAQGYFYGPRGLDISPAGDLYVTDTGNKRVQVFDLDGTFLREFGGRGMGAGRLDEPVGISISEDGLVAVADTWNKRVQVFDAAGTVLRQWQIPSWSASNPDEKPFLLWVGDRIFVTDPHRQRVLVFGDDGSYQWSLSAAAGAGLSFPVGLAAVDDTLYVSDVHNGELVGYELP